MQLSLAWPRPMVVTAAQTVSCPLSIDSPQVWRVPRMNRASAPQLGAVLLARDAYRKCWSLLSVLSAKLAAAPLIVPIARQVQATNLAILRLTPLVVALLVCPRHNSTAALIASKVPFRTRLSAAFSRTTFAPPFVAVLTVDHARTR